ncbi:MAG: phospholipase [Chrysiogenales bacterium]|nr:MAG: phospholipase [Chrysiogenales bacterium]
MGLNKKISSPLAFLALLCLGTAMIPAPSASSIVEVVSCVPLETSISRAGTRDAALVWLEMIQGARRSIDIAEFYLSGKKGQALDPLIEALLAAGRRGVRVRVLSDAAMASTYPETLKRFRARPNILTRLFDWKKLTGGIQHAKYFIVDDREVFIGSQNFDWRSLTHIQETGLRIRAPLFALALRRIFEADWQFNGGDQAAYQKLAALPPLRFSADAVLVASPQRFNPPGVNDALAALVALIDIARSRVSVQLLSYSLQIEGSSKKFRLIDQALRRAARRGVRVQMLVADWSLRASQVRDLQELALVPNVDVKFAAIPPFRGGFIPYARVVHSKVMRVDGDISWVGTSNWGHDYFYRSRNVEVVLRRPEVARVLDEIFLSLWNGPYVKRLEPGKKYSPPRIN